MHLPDGRLTKDGKDWQY